MVDFQLRLAAIRQLSRRAITADLGIIYGCWRASARKWMGIWLKCLAIVRGFYLR